MSFPTELESFRVFAKYYPDHPTLLIDTYDTLGSGIENAITVGLEQKKIGKQIGVRIDSGDLSYLPRVVRKRFDDAGLPDATISVSSDLNEEIVQTLIHDEVPIDSWGIGTHLVTGGKQSALNGVYKLVAKQNSEGHMIPTMKISNTYEKTTNPGIKQVWRFYDHEGGALADLITLETEQVTTGKSYTFFHPFSEVDFFEMAPDRYERCVPLLTKKVGDGKRIGEKPTLPEIQRFSIENVKEFHKTYLRLINPHIYKVSLSSKLKKMKMNLLVEQRRKAKEEVGL